MRDNRTTFLRGKGQHYFFNLMVSPTYKQDKPKISWIHHFAVFLLLRFKENSKCVQDGGIGEYMSACNRIRDILNRPSDS